MFKFLKEKLKSAISKISEGFEKEGEIEEKIIEKTAEEQKEEESNASWLHSQKRTRSQGTSFFAKLKEKIIGKENKVDEEKRIETKKEKQYDKKKLSEIEETKLQREERQVNEQKAEQQRIHEEKKLQPAKTEEKEKRFEKQKEKLEHKPAVKEYPKPQQKIEVEHPIKRLDEKEQATEEQKPIKKIPSQTKGFFQSIKEKIITTKINEEQFEKLFWDLELALMENNVAMEVIEKIKNDLKEELVEKPIRRTKVEETIQETLKFSIENLFLSSGFDLIQEIKNKNEKPYVIAFFGINGSGKTTSIAKLAHMLKEMRISCVLAASDTFRAASIEQLQQHADNIGVKLIKHDYGADPAAVAFDAIKHAKAKSIDAVLIDTAGRMHSNENLLAEMKKIIRVAKPDLKIFVGESITGNDCIEQAKTFNEAVGIDGIILAKSDVDEKGGAAVSVSYVTKKPILYFGTGQRYGDLQKFNSEIIMKNLGLA